MKSYISLPIGYDPKLANKVDNGCGPSGWKGKLVPDTIYGLSIKLACKIHDYEYHVGKTLEDKEIADIRFLKNLNLIITNETKWSKPLNPLRRTRANTYYLAVKHGGEEHFLKDKEGIK